jgi:single-strand DNA-binding protein
MLNKCCFIGNVGKDPEFPTENIGKFSLATTEYWTKDGEKHSKTEWVNIVVYGNQVKAVKHIRKGSKVYVEGKFTTRSWDKDGERCYATEIAVQSFGGQIVFLDPKGSSEDVSQNDSPFGD